MRLHNEKHISKHFELEASRLVGSILDPEIKPPLERRLCRGHAMATPRNLGVDGAGAKESEWQSAQESTEQRVEAEHGWIHLVHGYHHEREAQFAGSAHIPDEEECLVDEIGEHEPEERRTVPWQLYRESSVPTGSAPV